MPKSACPSPNELSAYLLGTLPAPEAERVFEHLEQCPECEVTLDGLETAGREDTLLDHLRRPPAEDPFGAEPECRSALARAEGLVDPDSGRSAAVSGAEPPAVGALGEYQLLEKLGEGGMGTVYKALHTKLDRVVALKLLPHDRVDDARRLARFDREMKAVGRLNHPNIVQAYDAREIEGTTVLVMEYVDGLDLSELVRLHGPLPIADACEVIRRAALGLQYAHEQGLVHRDVKPSNLMLTSEGRVKILDLGLALLRSTGPQGEEVTNTGQTVGTADYIAPEQVNDSHLVDVRADVYSLGCTLYKLLSGQAPFAGPDYQGAFRKMMAHVREAVPSIKHRREEIPDRLITVLDRMLAKNPDDRFATPGEVAAALDRFARGSDLAGLSKVPALSPPIAPRAAAAPRPAVAGARAARRWKPWTLAAALMLSLALVAVALQIVITIHRGDKKHSFPLRPGDRVEITAAEKEETAGARSRVDAGRLTKDPSLHAPPPAVAPFGVRAAQRHQQAWAEYLDKPVEMVNSVEMKMVLIPRGEFEMGLSIEQSKELLAEARPHDMPPFFARDVTREVPKFRVEITRPIYFGKHEVTIGQFRQFVDATGYVTDAERTGRKGDGSDRSAEGEWGDWNLWRDSLPLVADRDRHPVVFVTWNDALAFCRWLSEQEGQTYRLPTNAEWEYACRAGTTTPWHCGEDPHQLRHVANVGDASTTKTRPNDPFHQRLAPWDDGYPVTAPVGSFEPNGFGLCDMHGNVAEFCGNELQQHLRGAGWGRYWPLELSSAHRGGPQAPGARWCDGGFRVVYDPLPSTRTSPAAAPLDAKRARDRQRAWAEDLGVPVETTNTKGIRLALVPPGGFDMGATQAEIRKTVAELEEGPGDKWYLEHVEQEGPQHPVEITTAFYMGMHEVTTGQFRAFVEATGYRTDAEKNRRGGSNFNVQTMKWEYDPDLNWDHTGFPADDSRPVVLVSWNDAVAFCEWLSKVEGKTYRLPTEAEWEYAARAGSTTRYHFGDQHGDLDAYAWYGLNSRGKPHPVGHKKANPWRLYDVHGNVAEWCQDGFDPDYFGSSPSADPAGPASAEHRVRRGASWTGGGLFHRSASRDHADPSAASTTTGFRVVYDPFRDPPSPEADAQPDQHATAELEVSPTEAEAGQGQTPINSEGERK
jgi:formylglycine-generating enzyme required for sulfatase activity/serine/threonine protein kinase